MVVETVARTEVEHMKVAIVLMYWLLVELHLLICWLTDEPRELRFQVTELKSQIIDEILLVTHIHITRISDCPTPSELIASEFMGLREGLRWV